MEEKEIQINNYSEELQENSEEKQKEFNEERKRRVSTVIQDIKDIDLSKIDNPYELILLLIERASDLREDKVDILNFHLADITSDYLKIMEQIDNIDMEVSAEFIQIASTLIKIKSEMLLPKPDLDELQDAEDEERRILIATNEYKLFRDAAQKLTEIEDFNKKYREPAPLTGNYKIILKQMSVDNLINAFTKMIQKVVVNSNKPVQTIEKDKN